MITTSRPPDGPLAPTYRTLPSGLIRTHCVVVPGAWETSTTSISAPVVVSSTATSAPRVPFRLTYRYLSSGLSVRSLTLSASGWVPRTVFVATSMTAIASYADDTVLTYARLASALPMAIANGSLTLVTVWVTRQVSVPTTETVSVPLLVTTSRLPSRLMAMPPIGPPCTGILTTAEPGAVPNSKTWASLLSRATSRPFITLMRRSSSSLRSASSPAPAHTRRSSLAVSAGLQACDSTATVLCDADCQDSPHFGTKSADSYWAGISLATKF